MTDTTPTLPLLDYQIAYYRTELEMERISYGDLAYIDAVFDLIDPADLPEPAENATASDKLDEIQERTIVTLEGLDALPVGARIVMREGFTLHKVDEVEWVDEGSSMAYGTDEIMGAYGDGETLLPGLVISHGAPAGVTRYLLVEVTFDDVDNADTLLGEAAERIGRTIDGYLGLREQCEVSEVHPGDVVAAGAEPTVAEYEEWHQAVADETTRLGLDEWVRANRGRMTS